MSLHEAEGRHQDERRQVHQERVGLSMDEAPTSLATPVSTMPTTPPRPWQGKTSSVSSSDVRPEVDGQKGSRSWLPVPPGCFGPR